MCVYMCVYIYMYVYTSPTPSIARGRKSDHPPWVVAGAGAAAEGPQPNTGLPECLGIRVLRV